MVCINNAPSLNIKWLAKYRNHTNKAIIRYYTESIQKTQSKQNIGCNNLSKPKMVIVKLYIAKQVGKQLLCDKPHNSMPYTMGAINYVVQTTGLNIGLKRWMPITMWFKHRESKPQQLGGINYVVQTSGLNIGLKRWPPLTMCPSRRCRM